MWPLVLLFSRTSDHEEYRMVIGPTTSVGPIAVGPMTVGPLACHRKPKRLVAGQLATVPNVFGLLDARHSCYLQAAWAGNPVTGVKVTFNSLKF